MFGKNEMKFTPIMCSNDVRNNNDIQL